jgi:hypothetical protein
MKAIDRYILAKAEYIEAQAFVEIFDAQGAKVTELVYYHAMTPKNSQPVQMPNALRRYAEDEAKTKTDNIGRAALVAMAANLQEIAAEAVIEYRQLATDAGITLP